MKINPKEAVKIFVRRRVTNHTRHRIIAATHSEEKLKPLLSICNY